jgi:uncharacterized membrane protein
MAGARNFFTPAEQERIVKTIAEAELHTSGEIRLHLENYCKDNELEAAGKIFAKLGMHQTAERNGVLIYIAVISHKIAIVGDEGIHQKVGSGFWDHIIEDLISGFKSGNKTEALVAAILECGQQLGTFFPRKEDDQNELSNEISFKPE